MDFKSKISNNAYKAFYAVVVTFWAVIVALLLVLWNKYSSSNINLAMNQIEIFHNLLLSINPDNIKAINKAPHLLVDCQDNPIEDVYIRFYDTKGNLLYTNDPYEQDNYIYSFDEIKELYDNSNKDLSNCYSLFFTGSFVFSGNVDNTVCINIKGYFNLWNTSWCRWNSN